MSNMAFSHTSQQCRDYQKTVTRRLGRRALQLKPAQVLQQVVKGMGIPKGDHAEKIHRMQVISNNPEPLNLLLTLPEYGRHEMIKEGFPDRDPQEFVDWFCKASRIKPSDMISRLDFRYYLDPHSPGLKLLVPENIAVCPSCKGRINVHGQNMTSWELQVDGTMICNEFGYTCSAEPDIEDRKAYVDFMDSHAQEFSMPYIYRLPVDAAVSTWLDDTFRFEI